MSDAPNPVRQYVIMVAVCTTLLLIGVGFAAAYFMYGVRWAMWDFFGFVGAGFVAQIWFIRAFGQSMKGK